MGDAGQAATALLTEHLQYTPLSLIDDIINSVNTLVYQGISSLENGLTATPPARLGFKPAKSTPCDDDDGDEPGEYPGAKQEIEEGLHQLETLLESTVDKNFDKFEIYVLRNVFSVPVELANWIRLSHYENLSYPPRENDPTQASVQILRRKVIESQKLQTHLKAEVERNDKMIADLKAILRQPVAPSENSSVHSSHPTNQALSFLTSTPSAKALNLSAANSANQPLTTNTNFALSQLPALRALLADLRPKLATLQSASSKMDNARGERREERREYIEQRARSHLERNAGPDLLNRPATMPGRKLRPEEIQALEEVSERINDG